MGALPKRKISTRRKGKRRLNKVLATKNLVVCKQCGDKKISHQICESCGTYR